MNARHSQDKLARGSRLLPPHTEVPEELCFDTSCLIAVSIKIFFRKIMRAGQGREDRARLCLVRGCVLPAVLMQGESERK